MNLFSINTSILVKDHTSITTNPHIENLLV
ncbi:Uncharacterised protein [Providencia rustigianii]|uniref:Uncharacterized protein n=1 Tax=Providencia rustigianii TaxID=158850 RepID=A0A379G2T1_9GAMM|nr:Uncharacterised protein [Providencia rustigianii]SUC26786.1 Uncharacterised protein [Providencia rustigianii]SUC35394.1 Uncharacterised protein [Providencia rustigianii]VEB69260.1 Uncharacterised protein [Providencia rustigianii]VEH55265.1 Uncharacterised protein [Providencia rustigianii]